jgi:hypothetical protein
VEELVLVGVFDRSELYSVDCFTPAGLWHRFRGLVAVIALKVDVDLTVLEAKELPGLLFGVIDRSVIDRFLFAAGPVSILFLV